jgi:uncharacterized protein (TIGR03437 family)
MRQSFAIFFLLSAVAFAQAPSISSTQPAAVNAGDPAFTLTVNGAGFVSGSTVKWSGTPLVTSFVSASQLTASVPANLFAICGRFPVIVSNPSGGSSGTNVSVLVNPVLSAITPNSVPAGNGGFTVTAFGQGFSSNVVLTLNANGGHSNLQTAYTSTTTLSGSIPGSALTGVYPVSVQVTDLSTGAATPALPVTLTYAQLTQIAPTAVNAGDPDFTLALLGANFVPGAQVLWNGSTPLATQFQSSTILTATVPAALYADPAGGQIGISVKNPGAAPTNSLLLIVNPDPRGTTLTSLQPPQAVTGGPDFTLTAIGSRFTPQSVIVWQTTSMPTTFVDSTKLTTTIPASFIAIDGSAAISIATPGVAPSAVVRLPIVTGSPAVTSITPASVSAGAPAFTLTVTGTGFIPASKIVTTPDLSLATTYVSFTQLTTSVPASALVNGGRYEVRVSNPGGYLSPAPAILTVKAATPAITRLTPASVTAGSGDFTLTVTGSSFTANAVVGWNGSNLATTVVSSTQVTAAVPAALVAAAGNVTVTVSNEGPVTSNALTFAVVVTPTIAAVNPNSVASGGPAFTLTVTGTGFNANSKVQWNGTALATTLASGTQLTAAVPANLIAGAGTVSITVAGDSGVSNAVSLTITGGGPATSAAGIVNAASSAPAIAPGTLISIYGSNLAGANASAQQIPLDTTLGGTSVSINGTAIPLLFVSPGQINAQVPYEVNPGTAKLVVQAGSAKSAEVSFPVAATGPGVFTIPQGNHVVAQNLPDYSLNSATAPASPGQYCTLYVTGQGAVKPPLATGAGAPDSPLSLPVANVQVKIGGQPAEIQFAGLAPGFVGLLQVNVKIPSVAAGEQPVELTVGGVTAGAAVISVGN